MATSFKREPKIFTNEPSADEVKDGMKRGGKAKKMMDGGIPMAVPARRRAPMVAPAAVPRRAAMPVVMRKKGGEVETPKQHKAEMHAMGRIEKELKHHESMRASKAHKGLKAGGSPAPKAGPNVIGGLAGGLEATRPVSSRVTGGVRSPGYKSGGNIGKSMAFETVTTKKPKLDLNDKVHQATSHKKEKGHKGIEGVGYKAGGRLKKYASGGMAIAAKYQHKINDASSGHKSSGKTGDIEGSHYKHGGHVAHHKSHSKHADGGHVHMHKHSAKHSHGHTHQSESHMKHGGHAKHHMKKGGTCNY